MSMSTGMGKGTTSLLSWDTDIIHLAMGGVKKVFYTCWGGFKKFWRLAKGGSKKFDDKNVQLPSPHQSIYEHFFIERAIV